METLDENIDKRRNIYQYYKNELNSLTDVEFMPEIKYGRSTLVVFFNFKNKPHDFVEEIINNFKIENIELRPIWKPMHMQPLYSNNSFFYYEHKPVSEFLFEHGLCLPSGSNLLNSQLQRIVNLFKKKPLIS